MQINADTLRTAKITRAGIVRMEKLPPAANPAAITDESATIHPSSAVALVSNACFEAACAVNRNSACRIASFARQPRHALGAALVEGRSECLFAGLVTTALTGKDRDPGDPARKKFRAASLDPKHDPAPHVAVRKTVRRQRQDQPSPLL